MRDDAGPLFVRICRPVMGLRAPALKTRGRIFRSPEAREARRAYNADKNSHGLGTSFDSGYLNMWGRAWIHLVDAGRIAIGIIDVYEKLPSPYRK